MRLLFLAISSFLIATSLVLMLVFATMAIGVRWYEPDTLIAWLEFVGMVPILIVGVIGWLYSIKRCRHEVD